MKWNSTFDGELGETGDVVNESMREVGCGANKKNGIAVNKARYAWKMYLVRWSGTSDEMNFDTEILTCFAECCVCCFW